MSKTIAITGGTTGIGLALAKEFLQRGQRVALCNLDQDQIDCTIASIEAEFGPGRAIGVQCDVTKAEELQQFQDKGVEAFGRIDIWINNAGLPGGRAAIDETDPTHILAVARVGLGSSLLAARSLIPAMRAQGGGWIWNMEGYGSTGQTRKGMTVYGATKKAIHYLNKALRKEAEGTDVKIGAIRPGLVITDMVGHDPALTAKGNNPTKRIVNIIGDRPETIAPPIAARILSANRDGTCIRWLTKRRALWRLATAPFSRRDILRDILTDTSGA